MEWATWFVENLYDALEYLVIKIINVIKEVFTTVFDAVAKVLTHVRYWAVQGWQFLCRIWIQYVYNPVMRVVISVWNAVCNVCNTVYEVVCNVCNTVYEVVYVTVTDVVLSAYESVCNAIDSMYITVINILGNVG